MGGVGSAAWRGQRDVGRGEMVERWRGNSGQQREDGAMSSRDGEGRQRRSEGGGG